MRDALGYDHEQGQGALKALNRAQFKRFNSAGNLQDVERHLDFPARGASQSTRLHIGDEAIGQQTPLDWFDTRRCIELARDDAGGSDRFVFACCGRFNSHSPARRQAQHRLRNEGIGRRAAVTCLH
jgi:hypothetical protein